MTGFVSASGGVGGGSYRMICGIPSRNDRGKFCHIFATCLAEFDKLDNFHRFESQVLSTLSNLAVVLPMCIEVTTFSYYV